MPRRTLAFALAAMAIAAMPARAADPLPRAAPEAVGLSAERLARIGATITADVERGRLPGAVIAVARRGRLAYYESFGFLDRAAGTPMPRDAIFPIASMTKPMVGVAALTLLEEGRLALTDPVARFLPELGQNRVAAPDALRAGAGPVQTIPADRPMNIEDIMRHTSGLNYGNRGDTAVHALYRASTAGNSTAINAAEFLRQLSGLPLLHQPGTTWGYGLSTDVLGVVVEKISGQGLGAYLQQRVFAPLGMADTGFVVPEANRGRYARGLPQDPDSGAPINVTMGLAPRGFECGGGCAVSTVADYTRFAQMLLSGGALPDGPRILGRKTVEAMTSDHMGAEIRNTFAEFDPTLVGYGFGLTVAVRTAPGARLLGSPGLFTWGGAFGTNFWVDPKEELVVVFMAVTPGPMRQYYRRVVNAMVYGAITD